MNDATDENDIICSTLLLYFNMLFMPVILGSKTLSKESIFKFVIILSSKIPAKWNTEYGLYLYITLLTSLSSVIFNLT